MTHNTAQDRAHQEAQSSAGFRFEPAVALHTSAPRSLPWFTPISRAVAGCTGRQEQPGLHMQHQALTLVLPHELAASGCLPRCTVQRNQREQISALPAPAHTHRGCRMGSQTIRITHFKSEPNPKDFKPQSGTKHAPCSQPPGAFPMWKGRAGSALLNQVIFLFFLS